METSLVNLLAPSRPADPVETSLHYLRDAAGAYGMIVDLSKDGLQVGSIEGLGTSSVFW